MKHLLTTALNENKIELSGSTQQQLINYLELMQRWNKVFNLTTITEPREMVYLHLIDSLVVQPFLKGDRFLDVGSGAGLPGIPLAIVNPDQHWTLLDKNNKKTRFLTQACAELRLSNVEVVHARCEDFQPSQCFDTILSRAFGTLGLFAESTAHLLCTHGQFIAMKGKHPQEEIDDLPTQFVLQKSVRLDIKGMDAERHICVILRSVFCDEGSPDAS